MSHPLEHQEQESPASSIDLRQTGGTKAIASMCIGGMGISIAIENV